MKKILVLAFSLGALTTVFGQHGYPKSDRDDSRDVVVRRSDNDDENYSRRHSRNDDYSFTIRERDARIERINRFFHYKIMSVKRDDSLRKGEKKRKIRMLEEARKDEIREVHRRFSRQKGSYNGDRNRNRY